MDRPIDAKFSLRKRNRRIIQAGLLLVLLVTLFLILSALIRPGIDRKEIQTSIVRRGRIEGSISAEGTVVPSFEQTLTSPTETKLLAVRKRPGDKVFSGDKILELDRSGLLLMLDRTEKDLALKANQQVQLKLEMEQTLTELKGQLSIKELRLQYLTSKSEQGKKMYALGAVSKDQLDQMLLEERIAGIEREDLSRSIQKKGESLGNQLDGITTEVRTLLKEKAEIRRQLESLDCRAGREGVVTWVKEEIGASIHAGDVVARVADLQSYRVEATISDIHAATLTVGMPARVRINGLTIPGEIETVYPAVENGTARLTIHLKDSSNRVFRPNLRVDVSLVTHDRDSVLIVRRGPFVNGEGVYVIRGDIAQMTPIRIGLLSFDEVEIAAGLQEGDEIIISDMSEFKHLGKIKIR